MGLLGIFIGLALLIWFAFRGWSILLLAPISALVAALFGGGPLLANLTQALLCGLVRSTAHWLFVDRDVAACLAAFALGVGPALIVGWVRQRTGSLLLPWAAHGAGNLIAGVVATLTR